MADFKVKFGETPNFKAQMGEVQMVTVGKPPYEGAYEVTPTTERQMLSTKDKTMTEDIVINPIPQKYGLITYNQNRIITVS